MAVGSPTIVSGARDTLLINQNSRVVFMHDKVMLYEADKNPLSLLATSMSRKAVYNPKFSQLEDELIPDVVNVDTGITAGDTAVTLSSGEGSYLTKNTLLVHQVSGEVAFVSAVSTDTLTIARSHGPTAAAAWTAGDDLLVLHGAAAEGVTAEAAISTKKADEFNYTQICRKTMDITKTDMASRVYGGVSEHSYQQMKLGIEWSKKLDMSFFFSERNSASISSVPRRSMDGLNRFISTNRLDMGGTFSYVTFVDWLKDLTRYGSGKIVLFGSRGLVANISLEAMGFLEMGSSEKSLGMEIMRLRGPFGADIRIITHNSLKGQKYGGYGFFIDPTRIGYRYLSENGENRDVALKTNIQANDADKRTDEMLGEVSMFRANEQAHGVITNAGTTSAT